MESKKILFVDDDEDITTLFTFRLKKEGYESVVATSGKEALQKLEGEPFDLVILDRMLPDMKGDEVAKQLKTGEKTRNIPIILISGAAVGDEAEYTDRFLLKPFEWDHLKASMVELLSK